MVGCEIHIKVLNTCGIRFSFPLRKPFPPFCLKNRHTEVFKIINKYLKFCKTTFIETPILGVYC